MDGCHLKGNHGDVLLSTISIDGNNEKFPIAYGVVGSKPSLFSYGSLGS